MRRGAAHLACSNKAPAGNQQAISRQSANWRWSGRVSEQHRITSLSAGDARRFPPWWHCCDSAHMAVAQSINGGELIGRQQ